MYTEIKDSEGKTYSTDVTDHLVKMYRFMVRENLQFIVANAYLADHRISMGMTGNSLVAEKFIKELNYVKSLEKAQPITYIQVAYQKQKFDEVKGYYTDEYELTGETELFTNKTFDKRKMKLFVNQFDEKPTHTTKYRSYKIEKMEGINLENLVISK